MTRPVTLFTGQWADMPLETLCAKAQEWGYDGLELACWGDHFDVHAAASSPDYCRAKHDLLARYGLRVFAISNHLVGQAVADRIDERHRSILPAHVWGDGDPAGVRHRAVEEMKVTARAAAAFGVSIVNGFTGSGIWHLLYAFPPVPDEMITAGFHECAELWRPILDEFQRCGVRFALEVHPTEIAFDIPSAERILKALDHHPAFGFNFDPSHFAYQGADYVAFIRKFGNRIFHSHVKDVWWSPAPAESGVFGGHLAFGDARRYWDFRSPGRGRVDFESIIRALNDAHYSGPLSVEWEDPGMDREHGAREAASFVKKLDFAPTGLRFDAAFDSQH